MRFCTAAATHHVAGALRALDAERDHRLAVEAGEGAAVRDGVGDGAEVVETHLAAAEQRDHGAGEIVQRLGAGQRPDRLIVLADFGAAAGQVDIGAAQALADIDGGEACGLQPVGIERDQDFALDTADTLDLGNAAHALKCAFDDVVDEIGQLLRRLAGRDRGIGDDRRPITSTRWISGSLTFCGKLARTRVTASLTSLSARSVLVSSANWIVVTDRPSVIEDEMCRTPSTPDTPSSMVLVTWLSSSAGAAPNCATATEITGMSAAGSRVTASLVKLTQPSTRRMMEKTMDGSGFRIDHAEILSAISVSVDRVHPHTSS